MAFFGESSRMKYPWLALLNSLIQIFSVRIRLVMGCDFLKIDCLEVWLSWIRELRMR